MILDYYSTKAGVDTKDQMVHAYTAKRKTRRWPMAIFYNMPDIIALNACVILAAYSSRLEGESFTQEKIIPDAIWKAADPRKYC